MIITFAQYTAALATPIVLYDGCYVFVSDIILSPFGIHVRLIRLFTLWIRRVYVAYTFEVR